MAYKTSKITRTVMRKPISFDLKKINPKLKESEYTGILFELDGLNEMLLNYVDKPEDSHERINFIDTFIMFIAKYNFLAHPDNLYVVKIVLLNELFKKNQKKQAVLDLVQEEHHFSHQKAAAFKAVIKNELRDILMYQAEIYDREGARYREIVKPFIEEFEDFYYSFR